MLGRPLPTPAYKPGRTRGANLRRMKKRIVLLGCACVLPALAATDLFGKMDANHDRRITAGEHAAAARAMFRSMDADHDGKVTPAEMTAAQRRINGNGRSGLSSEEKIRAIDSDRDGILTSEEHQAGSEVMFAVMDRNKDGRLTRKEYAAGHAKLLAKK